MAYEDTELQDAPAPSAYALLENVVKKNPDNLTGGLVQMMLERKDREQDLRSQRQGALEGMQKAYDMPQQVNSPLSISLATYLANTSPGTTWSGLGQGLAAGTFAMDKQAALARQAEIEKNQKTYAMLLGEDKTDNSEIKDAAALMRAAGAGASKADQSKLWHFVQSANTQAAATMARLYPTLTGDAAIAKQKELTEQILKGIPAGDGISAFDVLRANGMDTTVKGVMPAAVATTSAAPVHPVMQSLQSLGGNPAPAVQTLPNTAGEPSAQPLPNTQGTFALPRNLPYEPAARGNAGEQKMREQVRFSPEEAADNARVEAQSKDTNIAALQSEIKKAKDPKVRAALEAELANVQQGVSVPAEATVPPAVSPTYRDEGATRPQVTVPSETKPAPPPGTEGWAPADQKTAQALLARVQANAASNGGVPNPELMANTKAQMDALIKKNAEAGELKKYETEQGTWKDKVKSPFFTALTNKPVQMNQMEAKAALQAKSDFIKSDAYESPLRVATAARNAFPALQSILDSDAETDAATTAKAWLTNFSTAFGKTLSEKETQSIIDAYKISKGAGELQLNMQLEQKGVQTDGDAKRMFEILFNPNTTPAVRRATIRDYMDAKNEALTRSNFMAEYVNDKNNLGRINQAPAAYDAWKNENKALGSVALPFDPAKNPGGKVVPYPEALAEVRKMYPKELMPKEDDTPAEIASKLRKANKALAQWNAQAREAHKYDRKPKAPKAEGN